MSLKSKARYRSASSDTKAGAKQQPSDCFSSKKGMIWVRTETWEEISAVPDMLHLPGEDNEAAWLRPQRISGK